MNKRSKFIAIIGLTLLGGGLWFYAASRTLDFVQSTLTADNAVWGYLFLLSTGGGALIWLLTFLTYADGFKQRGIAFLMGIIDLIGEGVLTYADTMRVSSQRGLLTMSQSEMSTFITASVGLVLLNLAAIYAFHLFNPQAERQSQARDLTDEVTDATMKQLNTPEARRQMIEELSPTLRTAIIADVTEQIYAAAGHLVDGPNRVLPVNNWPGAAPTEQKEAATGFFDRAKNLLRHPFKPATNSAARQNNHQAVWTVDHETGQARRLFCLSCLYEGKDWTGPQICEHIDLENGHPATIHSTGAMNIPNVLPVNSPVTEQPPTNPATANTGNAVE